MKHSLALIIVLLASLLGPLPLAAQDLDFVTNERTGDGQGEQLRHVRRLAPVRGRGPVLAFLDLNASGVEGGIARRMYDGMARILDVLPHLKNVLLRTQPEQVGVVGILGDVARCGGIRETECLVGVGMEKGAQVVLFGELRLTETATLELELVLADAASARVLDKETAELPTDQLDTMLKAGYETLCNLMSPFGCLPEHVNEGLALVPQASAGQPEPQAQQPTQAEQPEPQPELESEPRQAEVPHRESEPAEREQAGEPVHQENQPEEEMEPARPVRRGDQLPFATLGWSTLGVGLVLLGSGTAMAVLADQRYQDYRRATLQSVALAAKRDTKNYGNAANILLPIGGVLTAAGAVFVVLEYTIDQPVEEQLSVEVGDSRLHFLPAGGPGQAGVLFGGTF